MVTPVPQYPQNPRNPVLAALVLLAALLAPPAAAQGVRCRAVDGDTLRCGAERVRVVGLDAPELHGARCPAELRLARAASSCGCASGGAVARTR